MQQLVMGNTIDTLILFVGGSDGDWLFFVLVHFSLIWFLASFWLFCDQHPGYTLQQYESYTPGSKFPKTQTEKMYFPNSIST